MRRSWCLVDEHLEMSEVGAGRPLEAVGQHHRAVLEAVVARERRPDHWALRHQPASSCRVDFEDGKDIQ